MANNNHTTNGHLNAALAEADAHPNRAGSRRVASAQGDAVRARSWRACFPHADTEEPQALRIVPFGELRDDNDRLHPPIIDGLLREGETCNIIADSKVGKSWLVYGLALSIITGRKWLERFDTHRGKVLLIDNELHPATLAHRIPAVGTAMNLLAADYENDLEVVCLRGRLRSLADLAADLEVIEPGTYQTIILDAKYRFIAPGASENDNAAETQFYNTIDRIAERTQAAIVLVHHASKGSQTDKKITDVGSGAGAQSRAADCHVVLRQHEEPGVAVLEAAVRSFKPVEPLALRWEFPLWVPADGIDTRKLKGRLSPKEQQQTAKDQEDISKILTALVDGPLTSTVLGKKTGVTRERRGRLLDYLCSTDQITFEETVKRGNPCYVYELAK